MAVLVIADHDNAALKDNTHKTVTAALKLSGDVDVLVAGQGARAVADEAACCEGAHAPQTRQQQPTSEHYWHNRGMRHTYTELQKLGAQRFPCRTRNINMVFSTLPFKGM